MTLTPRTRLLALALTLLALAAATRLTGIGPLAAHDAPTTATAPTPNTPAATSQPTAPATAPPTTQDAGRPATTTPPAATTPSAPPSTPRPQDQTAAANGTLAPDRAAQPGAPLRGGVSAPSLPDFERANVALINLEHATSAPVRPMARAAHQACQRLDTNAPLLLALRRTCRDTIITAKLSRVLGRRCTTTSTTCARTAGRLADAADRLTTARRRYAKVLRRTLSPSSCRTALLPTGADLRSERRLAAALHTIADAAQSNDPAALAAAGTQLSNAAARSTTDGRTATAVITDLRAACWLPRYPDPIS